MYDRPFSWNPVWRKLCAPNYPLLTWEKMKTNIDAHSEHSSCINLCPYVFIYVLGTWINCSFTHLSIQLNFSSYSIQINLRLYDFIPRSMSLISSFRLDRFYIFLYRPLPHNLCWLRHQWTNERETDKRIGRQNLKEKEKRSKLAVTATRRQVTTTTAIGVRRASLWGWPSPHWFSSPSSTIPLSSPSPF